VLGRLAPAGIYFSDSAELAARVVAVASVASALVRSFGHRTA